MAGETKVLGENLTKRYFVHHKPGSPCEKPATNRLSYGAALSVFRYIRCCFSTYTATSAASVSVLELYFITSM
jgi:hypothetical protein